MCTKFTPNLMRILQCVNVNRSLIKVIIITRTSAPDVNIDDFVSDMIPKISKLRTTFVIRRYSVNFEYEVIDYSELYSWSGEIFKSREGQINKTLTYDGIEAAHPGQTLKEASSASVVVIVQNIDILLDNYLVGSPRPPFHSTRMIFNIFLLEKIERTNEKVRMALNKLWRDYGIIIAVLVSTCDDTVSFLNYILRLSHIFLLFFIDFNIPD